MSLYGENSAQLPIANGDTVHSDFEVLLGFEYSPNNFDEPHIGIAAQVSSNGVVASEELVEYWRALGAPEEAIWTPGWPGKGGGIISSIVDYAYLTYSDSGLLPKGETHMLYGDVVLFDYVQTKPNGGVVGKYQDDEGHIDYAPPEVPSASFFAPSNGGTDSWRGEFIYKGTTQPSYEDQLSDLPDHTLEPGEFLFTNDGRVYVHRRNPSITNEGRALTRLLIGPTRPLMQIADVKLVPVTFDKTKQ